MSSDEKQAVRRTVIVTLGPLAQTAGTYFMDLLTDRDGPHTAVAVVNLVETGMTDEGAFLDSLAQALTHISPPNLGSLLAQTGWQLVYPRDLQIFLVADTGADGDGRIRAFSQQVVDAVYGHLGLECLPTLIWLASGSPEETAVCLQGCVTPPLAQNILALSLLNEEGLRLAEPAALCHLTGELLWCLITTPLQVHFAEWATPAETVADGATPITTVGLTAWGWSPERAREVFARQWLQDVLALWLTNPAAAPSAQALHIWLQERALDRAGLTTRLQGDGQESSPNYAHLARHYPWPWQMRAHLQGLRGCYEEDTAVIADQKRQVATHQADTLRQVTEALSADLVERINAQPIGGSVAAAVWLWALAATCDDLYEQMLDDNATYDGLDADLAEERGAIEATLRESLESWPGDSWRYWLGLMLRPWRWPGLAWRYWRLRQLGLRLAALLSQQIVRHRQRVIQAGVGQTLAEMSRLVRQWHGRAGEIEAMLASWGQDMQTIATSPPEHDSGFCQALPLPSALYAQFVPNIHQEAALAAKVVDGLGRQIERLDEDLFIELRQLAEERLAVVWRTTAVDVLAATFETAEEWAQWRRAAWQAASPVWRYDEGCLPQMSRRSDGVWACFIGAGASKLPAMLALEESAAVELEPVSWLESGDSRRLFLVRLRRGLTPAALMLHK